MASFYQSLDVFALPSSVEGLPLVVLEAMASGNGIVASALPGMEEAVRPEINGLLFPVGDRGALTAALRRVLTDRELSLRMGNASRNLIVQEFSSTFAATQTEAVYRRRLAERPGCRRP